MKKHKIELLLTAEDVLKAAQNRGNIPLNNAISRNVQRLKEALRGVRKAQEVEPLCFLEPSRKDVPEDQLKEAREELSRWYAEEVEYTPYVLQSNRFPEDLAKLSPVREWLNEDQFQGLKEDFFITVTELGIMVEE